jgi:hypothetical protein
VDINLLTGRDGMKTRNGQRIVAEREEKGGQKPGWDIYQNKAEPLSATIKTSKIFKMCLFNHILDYMGVFCCLSLHKQDC